MALICGRAGKNWDCVPRGEPDWRSHLLFCLSQPRLGEHAMFNWYASSSLFFENFHFVGFHYVFPQVLQLNALTVTWTKAGCLLQIFPNEPKVSGRKSVNGLNGPRRKMKFPIVLLEALQKRASYQNDPLLKPGLPECFEWRETKRSNKRERSAPIVYNPWK